MGDSKKTELGDADLTFADTDSEVGGRNESPLTISIVVDKQTAMELYHAASVAIDLAAVSEGGEAGEQERIADAFRIIVRRRSAIELLNALAVNLESAPAPGNNGEQDKCEDVVEIIVSEETATKLLNALIAALGSAPAPRDDDGEREKGDVVETIVSKLTAMELLNALIINLGTAPAGKSGKGGRLEPQEFTDDVDYRPPAPTGRPPAPGMPPAARRPPAPTGKLPMRGADHPATLQRYVNLWFTKDRTDESQIDRTFALELGKAVYLRVNIGPFDGRHIMAVAEKAPTFVSDETIAVAFPETVGKPVPLEATIFGNDFDIPDEARTQKFALERSKPTTPLYFQLTPRREPDSELRLCVFYKNHLLQSLSVKTQVKRNDFLRKGGAFPRPQTVEVEVTFSADFANVAALPARGLWLGINQGRDDTHTLNVKNSERALSRNMESQIETALIKAREALLKVSFAPKKDFDGKIKINETTGLPEKDYRFDEENYPKGVSVDEYPKRFLADLTTLAAAGRNLYQAVFGVVPTAEERDRLQPVVDEMKATLRDEQIIQIARLKKMEDIWPWALMYDSLIDPDRVQEVCLAYRGHDNRPLPYAEGVKHCRHRDPQTGRNREKTVVCPYGFWGFKHIIEQPTQPGGKKAFTDLVFEIKIQPEPVLQMLLENSLGQTEAQHVTNMKALNFKPLTSLQAFTAGLDPASKPPPPEPHVVYFFCHGKYDAQQSPYLQVGANESLLPAELDELDFRWTHSHGLVFINGCHTAELLPKDLSSIMQPFIEAYASGIIGTEISVTTALAREFAQNFFHRFLADDSSKRDKRVGPIIKDLRLDLLMKYNPLGLVYTPYCSADLHVTY